MKECRSCGRRKRLTSFYRHPQMADGYLNKCKECVKIRVAKHRSKNLDRVREYDRNRPNQSERNEINKHNYRKRVSTPEGRKKERERKKLYYNKDKKYVNVLVARAIKSGKLIPQSCEKCGDKADAHHENYYEPLNITWLCKKHHGQRHREINEEIRSGVDWSDRGF